MPLIGGEIVVFTDANAMLDRGTFRALARSFADPKVGGVAGEKIVRAGGEGLYWRYESWLKRCDSAVSSVMGAAGELFALRRELYQPPEPDSLIEDFVMSLRLVEAGWRVVYEPEAVARETERGHCPENGGGALASPRADFSPFAACRACSHPYAGA